MITWAGLSRHFILKIKHQTKNKHRYTDLSQRSLTENIKIYDLLRDKNAYSNKFNTTLSVVIEIKNNTK